MTKLTTQELEAAFNTECPGFPFKSALGCAFVYGVRLVERRTASFPAVEPPVPLDDPSGYGLASSSAPPVCAISGNDGYVGLHFPLPMHFLKMTVEEALYFANTLAEIAAMTYRRSPQGQSELAQAERQQDGNALH